LARKILLADDSVTAQNMGRKILADAGYDVSTVNNGSAALKRIAEIKPDLIVLDVYMPGYSGLEVCQRLKDSEETAHIPVLLTVGKLEPFKPEEARRVRADAHIVKPFEASELLTAITRLEDRMVPQSEGGRPGAPGTGRKWETNSDPDNGWKSRLGFPSKKKKEEKEEPPEDLAAGSFRDFRKGKSKTGGGGAFTGKSTPAGQEPGLVPDIPRDITPEELDALSALAAKLDGPRVAAENVVAPAVRTSSTTAVVEVAPQATAPAAEDKREAEPKAEQKAEPKIQVETPAPVVDAVVNAAQAPVADTAAFAVEAKAEVVIPVEHMEPAIVSSAPVADTVAATDAIAVNTALLSQAAAPVDRTDEPVFASAASSLALASGEKTEAKPAEATSKSDTPEAGAQADPVAAKDSQNQDSDNPALPVQVAAVVEAPAQGAQETAQKTAAESLPETAEAEVATPSDEELAQALRLLTPATAHVEASTSSQPSLSQAGMMAGGPRWIAEPMVLSREEAAISLEEEMFRTFAATAATTAAMSAAALSSDRGPAAITGVSAIAAAVENRLAEAELVASTRASSEQEAERGLPEHSSEIRAAETSAVEGPTEVMAAISNMASPVFDEIAPETAAVETVERETVESKKLESEKLEAEKLEAEKIEAAKLAPEKLQAEQKDLAAKAPEESAAEETPAATFADAVGREEVEATTQPNGESFHETTGAVAEENEDPSSEAGGQESMGNIKSKTGKSNWHQIRTAPGGAAAASDAAETAEAPKAMAAAAAEGSASSSSSSSSSAATDASTIAGIVDSVMADLRPKIVEEIAKRLAGK